MENTLLNEFKEYIRNKNHSPEDLSSLSPTQLLLSLCEGTIDFKRISGLKKIEDYDKTDEFENKILKNLNIPPTNKNTINFICNEIIGNIYDHSKFNNGFVIGKEYENHHEMSFIDDGITIQKSLKDNKYTFNNEVEYIIEAINGLSTKNDAGYIERGTGLNNVINITVNGGNGEILIISGNALVYITKNEIYTQEIKNSLSGTLVSIKIKLDNKINIYNYLNQINYQ